MTKTTRILCIVLAMSLFASCASKRPDNLGLHGQRLASCPSSPNCVSSDAGDEEHAVEPYALAVDPDWAWKALRELLAARPRTQVITATGDYLHAEERSRLLGFVDDLEFHLRPEQAAVAVRSASRLGYSDLGVNRKRVEAIRQALRSRGIVR